jgi:argininosuccinate lyase
MSYNRDLQEITPHLWRGMDETRSTVRILDACISSVRFNADRLEKSSGAGFSTATELADSLVRKTGMPFRTAHQIVGRIAAAGGKPDIRHLDGVALDIGGFLPSERGFGADDLERALDPRSNVALRANTGGPAPSETARMIGMRQCWLAQKEDLLAKRRGRIARAMESLSQWTA